MRGRQRLTVAIRREIAETYLQGGKTYNEVADMYEVTHNTVWKCLTQYKNGELCDAVESPSACENVQPEDAVHEAVMQKKRQEHEEMTTWMEHVTPLHQHKQRLEAEITAKQAELDKAKQEYRNFIATLEKLTEGTP